MDAGMHMDSTTPNHFYHSCEVNVFDMYNCECVNLNT
jgi:hypothetical protein